MTEKITTKVGIELTGTAPAVKDFNAVIVTVLTELEVECMPQDLPERIVIDISGLAEIGDGVHVRDVVISDKVKILDDPDEMIVVASATRKEKVAERPRSKRKPHPRRANPAEGIASVIPEGVIFLINHEPRCLRRRGFFLGSCLPASPFDKKSFVARHFEKFMGNTRHPLSIFPVRVPSTNFCIFPLTLT